VRQRSQTIGTLGRTPGHPPGRATTPPPVAPRPPVPDRERGAVRRWLRSAFFDNIGLKFLSIVLAVTVFLLVNTDKDREITARVGVSYTLPEDKVLVSGRIDEVRVTIRGSWRRLRKFDERQIDRINLDLRHASSGELAIANDMIHLPSGIAVTSIMPRAVHVAFDKRVDKIVELTAAVTGHLAHGYIVAEVKPVPATVKLRGAQGVLAALTAIRTREISLEGRNDSFTAETEVASPDGVDVVGNTDVSVQVRVEEELVSRKVPGVSVALRDGDASRWKISPPQVDIMLTGALLAVEKARSQLVPIAKLTPEFKPREVEITIDGLPPGIGVKVSPERVKLTPVKSSGQAPRAP
jgi:YbbR domain-containing protein